jgi:hypothetical protein
MGNQFDARLIWVRREVWTIDESTGAYATIRDLADGSEKPFRWRIRVPDHVPIEGRAKSEQAARNAVRARVVKLPMKGEDQPPKIPE